jgi:Gpi18-like mannosyltransferase
MSISILWVILRILTSVIAGYVSFLRPITPMEITIPLYPPSAPIHQWLERALISPWMRWDALWYERIVSQGYSATDGTAQFHPLYPWLATPLVKIGVSPGLSLLIVGLLAGIALYYYFNKLALVDLKPRDAFFALMIFSLAPPAFILFAPYSEALFILLAVLCIYSMRNKSWWLAGIMGGLATLTRQQGIFLILPMAWEIWENDGKNFKSLFKHWRDLLALCIVASGMLVWILYRAFFINDFMVNFSNIQEFIYSTIISPSATAVVPEQKFLWPWQAIYYSAEKVLTHPDIDIWVNIIAAFLFLVILAFSWKSMRVSYRIYAFVITLVSFCYFTGTVHPYMGLPRHLFLAFPTFIGFTTKIDKMWMRLWLISASILGMSFLLILYVLKAWVP